MPGRCLKGINSLFRVLGFAFRVDNPIPFILEPEDLKPNPTWARLIQKIYEIDPLTCSKCQGRMKIISFIEDEEVIEKILKLLAFWT